MLPCPRCGNDVYTYKVGKDGRMFVCIYCGHGIYQFGKVLVWFT